MTHFLMSQILKSMKNREKSREILIQREQQRNFPKILYKYNLRVDKAKIGLKIQK